MANQSEAATTVDPQKWLGMLQRWCPAVRTAELVAFINLLIETGPTRRRSGRTAGTPAYDPCSGDFKRPPHRNSINQRRPVLHDMSTVLPQAQSLSPSAQMPRSDDPSRRSDVGLQPLRMERRRALP
jgi:hypothetical protein